MMHLGSRAFANNGIIPKRYTRDGENISPSLIWGDVPDDVCSFVLICTDTDDLEGPMHHWAVYDMPSTQHVLGEGAPPFEDSCGLKQAYNVFFHAGYSGPRPSVGDGVHRYHFRLLALSVNNLNISDMPTCAEVLREARRHVLSEATLVGTYERRSAYRQSHMENYAHTH